MLTHVKQDTILLSQARRRAILSLVIHLVLAVTKGIAGWAAGSTALLSDAVNSTADVFTSLTALFGLWIAGKEHPSFPYGLYKAETLATLVISASIMILAYEIVKNAFLHGASAPDVSIGIPAAFGLLLITLIFGIHQLRAGRRLNSPAIVADAKDYLSDGLATSVVLAGFIGTGLGYDLERPAAVIVGIFVLKTGGGLLISAVRDLLDASIDRETEREIIGLIEAHPRVGKVERLMSRTAGARYIVDIDVLLRTPSHQIADQVADTLEQEIVARFPFVIMARVRPHYTHTGQTRRITPVASPEGGRAGHFARAPWFLVETIDEKGEVIREEYIKNPHAEEERKKGYLVGKWLLGLKPDQVVAEEGREGTAIALLKEAGVEILPAGEKKGPISR
ncbi:MAG: cation diffusion facilitator family transporter [Deltaproteobacteria bacterium]